VFVGEKINDTLYQGKNLVEKPPKENIPSNLVFAGRYVLTAEIFDCLKKTPKGVNNEIQLTDGIQQLLLLQKVMGHVFSGTRYDVGNKMDFIKTNLILGLQRPDLKDELTRWLKEII
jgi:UTP--glucose-1-phosphate uridylyltransferase